jgi:hypothetical protein
MLAAALKHPFRTQNQPTEGFFRRLILQDPLACDSWGGRLESVGSCTLQKEENQSEAAIRPFSFDWRGKEAKWSEGGMITRTAT